MADRPDPGGVFDSDTHRRTLANLTEDGLTVEQLVERTAHDPDTDLETGSATQVLQALEADGDAEQADGAWHVTEAGLDKLNGPIADEPPPLEGEALAAAEAANEEHRKTTGRRAAEGRIESYQAQLTEIQEAIARDEQIVQEAS